MENLPLNSFLELLKEIYLGSNNEYTWVIDNAPDSGVLPSLNLISAEQASRSIVEGGSTLAAHPEHLRWSLHFALTYLQGGEPDTDWQNSWLIKQVDKEGWENLKEDLYKKYVEVKDAVKKVNDWSNPFILNGTLALLPHGSYHLGAMKQMILWLNKNS